VTRKPRHHISQEEFGVLVQQALAELPPPYASLAREVSVVVEEEPPLDVLEDLELDSADDLLGLYQGVSLAEESFFQPGGQQPARIAIYRGPILRLCETPEEVRQEIRDTVVHELGHHVGLADDELREVLAAELLSLG
jgi:predicted Zn-dependent protease with MMP-like domain